MLLICCVITCFKKLNTTQYFSISLFIPPFNIIQILLIYSASELVNKYFLHMLAS